MLVLVALGCPDPEPAPDSAPKTTDSGPLLRDSGVVELWWLGEATVGDDELAGSSWWTSTALPSGSYRCVWRQGWTASSPAQGCEGCDFAFELQLETPTVYDGEACDSGDTVVYSQGSHLVSEVVEAHTWRAGLAFSSGGTNQLYRAYGWGEGDLLYAYGGTWYLAYWAYASHDDGAFSWGEYWGRGYYYR